MLRALISVWTVMLTLSCLFAGDVLPCSSTPEPWPGIPAAGVSFTGNLLLQLHVARSSCQRSPELHAALWHGQRLGRQAPAPGLCLGRSGLRHHAAPTFLLLAQTLSREARKVLQQQLPYKCDGSRLHGLRFPCPPGIAVQQPLATAPASYRGQLCHALAHQEAGALLGAVQDFSRALRHRDAAEARQPRR